MDNRPVGVLDSGVGGFTVLKELQQLLPHEQTIFLGDSKRMPYGEKTNEEIIEYVDAAIRFLEAHDVKAILLACNTASSLIDQLSSNVPLFSIVEAGFEAAKQEVGEGNVGLIATRATVKNGQYDRLAHEDGDHLHFISYGTPTLAAVINNHPDEIELLKTNIRAAIDPIHEKADFDHLLLGCTHFPIVSETIQELYPDLKQINPAEQQAKVLTEYLEEREMTGSGNDTDIYITGSSRDYYLSRRLLDELGIYYNDLSLARLDIDDDLSIPSLETEEKEQA